MLRKKTTPLTPFFNFTRAVPPAPCAVEEHQAVEEPQDPQDASSSSSSMPASSSSSSMPASSSSSSMPATKGKGKGRQGNKGMPVRTVYKLKFKLRVVNKLRRMEELKRLKELDSPQQTVADVFNISQSLVSKWGAKERQLEEALKKGGAARKRISCIVKQRPGKYPLLEKQLYTDIRTKRAKGLRVTTKWIRIHMKKLISKEHGDDAAKDWKSTLSWRFKFCRRWGISLRRKTNSRKPLSDRLPKIKRWHARLVKRMARGKQLCPIFGRWPLSHRYDVDQVPCYFGNKDPVTLHCQEDGPRVRLPPNSGTDVKRDCSLQLCCRFIPKGGVQPKAGIVFKGTRQRIPKVETQQYDNRVVVFWQKKAWVNEEIACEWVLRVFKPFLQSINQREEV